MKTLIFPLLTALTFQSALGMVTAPGTTRIELDMDPMDRRAIMEPVKTEVSKVLLKVFQGQELKQSGEVSLKTRGQTSLQQFSRKNLSIESLEGTEKIAVGDLSNKKLILSASPEDILVTKNMLGYRILEAAGVHSLKTQYAEVVINQESQGLYMVTRHPEDVMVKQKDAQTVFRRKYRDKIELKKAVKDLSQEQIQEYATELKALFDSPANLKGQALLADLESKLDLERYMRLLAVNYLIRNGDYMDEVYFFGRKNSEGRIRFETFPWDLDDTFSKRMHLANLPFTRNFGKEQLSDDKLLFSFQSRLDRAIAKDPILNQRYFEVVARVISDLEKPGVLESIFSEVENSLKPYLSDSDVQKGGFYDSVGKVHQPEAILNEFRNRKIQIEDRLKMMKSRLERATTGKAL